MPNTVTIGALATRANYNSIVFKQDYTDNDDGSINAATIDMPKIRTTALANSGATTLAVTALPATLIANSYVSFFNGVRVLVTVTAAKGATSLTVSAISGAIPNDTPAFFSDIQIKETADTNWRFFLPMWPTYISTLLGKVSGKVNGGDTIDAAITAFDIFNNPLTNAQFAAGNDIYIDSERMTVGAISSSTGFSSVTRGVGGTTAAVHRAGSRVVKVGGTKTIYGSILPLKPNTSYDVRLLITQGSNEYIQTFSKTTAVDNFSVGATTHYVNSRTGDDTNNGTASGTPWKTLEKAITVANAATAAMVIEVEGGYYPRPVSDLTQTTHKITFKAANTATCIPAVDDARVPQLPSGFTRTTDNPGNALVYDRYTAPTGSGEGAAAWDRGFGGTAPWIQETQGGQVLWYLDLKDRAGAADSQAVQHLAYTHGNTAADKEAFPLMSAHWEHDSAVTSPNLDTVAGFGELVRTNYSLHYGYWQDINGTASRIYVRMPDDINPNECYIWLGSGRRGYISNDKCGFNIGGAAGHVITGMRIRGLAVGVRLQPGAKNVVCDHLLIEETGSGIMSNGDGTTSDTTEITGTTTQFCRIINSSQWSDDPITNRRIPWRFIKQKFWTAAGTEYPTAKVGSAREDIAIAFRNNVSDAVIRDCTIMGWMNGVNDFAGVHSSVGGVSDIYNVDIYRCTFINISDNPLEPEGPVANWKAWNNTFIDSSNVHSTDSQYGPFYYINNVGVQLGNWGVTDDGNPNATPTVGAGAGVVKFGCNVSPRSRYYHIGWTIRTTKKHINAVDFKGFVPGVAANPFESFMIINNIWNMRNKLTEFPSNGPWIVDEGNFYGTTSQGIQYDGRTFSATVVTGANSLDEWRKWDPLLNTAGSIILRGENTNKIAGTDYPFVGADVVAAIDAALTDVDAGDLSVAEDGLFYNTGVPVPGFDVPYPGSGTIYPYHIFTALPNRGGIQTPIGPIPPPPPPSTHGKADKTRKARPASA